MTAEETLQILSKVWCDTNDLMKLSQLGINNTTKLKKRNENKFKKTRLLIV